MEGGQKQELEVIPGPPLIIKCNPLVGALLGHKNVVLYLLEQNVKGKLVRTVNRNLSDHENILKPFTESPGSSFLVSFFVTSRSF